MTTMIESSTCTGVIKVVLGGGSYNSRRDLQAPVILFGGKGCRHVEAACYTSKYYQISCLPQSLASPTCRYAIVTN